MAFNKSKILVSIVILLQHHLHIVASCNKLPQGPFLMDFMGYLNSNNLILHVLPQTPNLTADIKQNFAVTNNSQKYFMVKDSSRNNCSMLLDNMDLHVVVIQEDDNYSYILDCLSKRKRFNKETWIIYTSLHSGLTNAQFICSNSNVYLYIAMSI
jgi:hypothetical protein